MSANELRKAVISDDELSFSHNGRDYLLYGWNQCDGYVLSLECEGELVWQSAPMSKAACTDELIRYYSGL
ncbi:MAG: hypothetical protein IKW96_11055 [Ruminococcus sp.]|uniref:hypothetical protein n=1 Tax=Ruminococcus sp. TaxID=41978 RepID=UPI0025E2DC03|nr:hypothetical protein [Ruminococcus sp.]MBR5683788.1 hypothetical protein [Ruminococcus sp.]